MTNDEARKEFKELGLTYEDVFSDLPFLKKTVRDALALYASKGLCIEMKLRKQIRGDKKTNAFLLVDGPYFKERECISFNRDGFIGFAGWADSKNSAPILLGFISWCRATAWVKKAMVKANGV